MSDIDLKALREAAAKSVAEWAPGGSRSLGDEVSLDAGEMLALLDRLESAERRAEEAEKERDALRGMFSAAVADIAEVSAAVGVPEEDAACANGNEEILECVEALRKDAERYRTMRATTTAVRNSKGERISTAGMPANEFDAAVDAMTKEQERGEG